MNWICLVLVAAAWWLGHATGYRLCKLRVKSAVRKQIIYSKVLPSELVVYGDILQTITKI